MVTIVSIILSVLLGICILGMLFCLVMMVRNNALYNYRGDIINAIHKRSQEDIDAGRDWRWRYDYFDTVSYDQMMYKFWKRFDSFYEDKSFIRRD